MILMLCAYLTREDTTGFNQSTRIITVFPISACDPNFPGLVRIQLFSMLLDNKKSPIKFFNLIEPSSYARLDMPKDQ